MQNAKAASLARFFPRPHKALLTLLCAMLLAGTTAQTANADGYAMKIFRVESGLYPFVQIYLRTFDPNAEPLINLNERNVGVMVAGRAYDPFKRQYFIQSVRNRQEMIRSVLLIDTSATMTGAPFKRTMEAIHRFIDIKRPQDQVAIIALKDNTDGYELVSPYESNPTILHSRLEDVKATGKKTRLYDGIVYALQTAIGMAGAGGSSSDDAEYPASSCIIVFSDGKDEGSSIDRADLMNRITSLEIPIPIYSVAYTRINQTYLKNLQALSKNSFGVFYSVHESQNEMTKTIERIQNILQNDYIITFRSYIEPDGRKHSVKVGIEYPANSGKMRYESAEFEAIESLDQFPKIRALLEKLNANIPLLPNPPGPYFEKTNTFSGQNAPFPQ